MQHFSSIFNYTTTLYIPGANSRVTHLLSIASRRGGFTRWAQSQNLNSQGLKFYFKKLRLPQTLSYQTVPVVSLLFQPELPVCEKLLRGSSFDLVCGKRVMLKRPCHYYNTTGKCHFGKHCKFLHDIDISTEQGAYSSQKNEAVNQEVKNQAAEVKETILHSAETKNKDATVSTEQKGANSGICRFYANNRFCRYGNRCKYQHILPKQKINNVKKSEDVENNQNDDSTRSTQDKVQDEGNASQLEDVAVPEASVKDGNSKKVCKFFKQGFCKYGRRCTFSHSAVRKGAADSTSIKESSVSHDEQKVNLQQITEEQRAACEWRQVRRPPKIINVYTRDDVIQEKQAELRETEIKQLKRRFPADRLKIVTETPENAVFIFTFVPTDPDWPFDVKAFDIQVEFGPDYPLKLFKLSVPFDQDLPATVRRYIEVSLEEWVAKKEEECVKKNIVELLFRPFLRWLDRNMEIIVTEGLKQLRRELTAKAAGLQFISANELQKDTEPQASSEPDQTSEIVSERDSRRPVAYRKTDCVEETYEVPAHKTDDEDINAAADDDDDDEEGSADSGEGEGDDEKVHQRPKIDPDTERKGTEMSFRNMQIWYCTTIMMEKLRLTVQCERCKNNTDFVTPPNRVNSVTCSKCNNPQLVVFRPVLTHAYSSTFGYLDLDGCTAQDVILQDCHFSLGCIMCSRDILVKSFIPGRVMEVWCRGCHSKMKFAAESVKLAVLTSDGVDSSKFSGKIHLVNARKNQRTLKDPAIQEGKPLPNNGACKHYKKSYRWLRFPCCGKTYPCDICHDDNEDHEMKYANRMICGFCCKEQPFALEKPCARCSSSLTKVRSSHWEGGRGCRDKIAMSRADGKKYTNLHKTVSNKAKASDEKNKGKKNTKLRHT